MDGEGNAEKEREILCIHVYEFQREIVSFRILLFGASFSQFNL